MTVGARSRTEDAALVARCLEGDGAAWENLVDRHGPLVWAVARKAGLSRDDAADVFQSTWTAALQDLPGLRKPERISAWIGRVARHQCMRVRRSYGIARRAHERIAREDIDRAVPDETLAALELRQQVGRALGKIGERCAGLLRALYYEHPKPTYERISERLSMRIGSIGPTRARCLEKLQTKLGR